MSEEYSVAAHIELTRRLNRIFILWSAIPKPPTLGPHEDMTAILDSAHGALEMAHLAPVTSNRLWLNAVELVEMAQQSIGKFTDDMVDERRLPNVDVLQYAMAIPGCERLVEAIKDRRDRMTVRNLQMFANITHEE